MAISGSEVGKMAIIVQHIEDRPGNHDKSDPYPYIFIALPENSLASYLNGGYPDG